MAATRLTVFEKYEVIRRLASGGMGDIFLARQTGAAGFNRLAVLKSLRPEVAERSDFLAQFLDEARTAARLNHPNVVAVYDVGEYRGVYFLAMEYIRGSDVSALAKAAAAAEQRIPQRLVAAIIHDAALGLFHAHQATDEAGRSLEIVHRDVSPQNLMVRLDGLTKVVDFGIAAARDSLGRQEPGKVQGKLRYLAPEQLEGGPVDARADQYSLGVVLYELLTRARPFTGRTPKEVFGQILGGGIPAAAAVDPTIDPELSRITERMLERRPADRFANLEEVAHALRPLRDQGPPVEALLSRFATALVGRRVQALTQNLTPEPVEVAGLLAAAERPCPACGVRNPIRDRYCRSCGVSLVGPGPTASVSPAEPKPVKTSALTDTLKQAATRARSLTDGDGRPLVALWVHFPAGGDDRGAAAGPRQRGWVLEQWAEAEGAQLCGLDRDTALFALGVHKGSSPRQATLAATRLASALAATGDPGATLALAEGPGLLGGGAGKRTLSGPAPDQARTLLELAQGQAGVFVTDAISRTLPRTVRQAAVTVSVPGGTDVLLCRIEVGGEAARIPVLPLFGRRAELITAEEVLSQGLLGRPSALLVASEPGLGKSRFLDELALRAESAGALVLRVDGGAPRGPGLLGAAVEAGLSALAEANPESDPLDLLGLDPPARRRLLLCLGREVQELAEETTEPRLREEATLVRALVQLSDLSPLCLLIDDLHLLPATAMGHFDGLAQRLRGGRIAVFATVDQAELSSLDPRARTLTLPPLGDDKILALAGAVLGAPLPPAAAHLLLEHADGSPAMAVLLAELLLDQGGLGWVDGQLRARPSLTRLELPHRIDELAALRMARLDKATRDFLRVGAVVGVHFPLPLVARALGRESAEIPLAAAVEARLLTRASGEGTAHFPQPQLRVAVLERLTTVDRQKVHRRLAEVLAEDPALNDPNVAHPIVTHLLAGGALGPAVEAAAGAIPGGQVLQEPELVGAIGRGLDQDPAVLEALSPLAIGWLVQKGVPIWALRDLEAADRLAERLGPMSVAATEAALCLTRAELRRRRGRLSDAAHDAARALALTAPQLQARPLALQAAIWEDRGELARAAEALERAVAVDAEQDPPDLGLRSSLANALGRIYLKLGRTAEALPLFEAAQGAALAAADPGREAQALVNLAAAVAPTDPPLAASRLAQAATLAEQAGDPIVQIKIALNQGRLQQAQGRLAEARAAIERGLVLAREVGWSEGEALALEAGRGLFGAVDLGAP